MEAIMNVLFSVRKSKVNRNSQLPIYIRITIGELRFESATGKFVAEDKWSMSAGRVKGASNEAKEINGFLDSLTGEAHAIQRQIIQEGTEMSMDVFKNKWLGIDSESVDLLELFEEHNSKIEALIGQQYARATHLRYQTTLKHTRDFIFWKFKVTKMDVRKLNFQFISDFEFYLKSVRRVGHNATMKYLANLKKIVLICVKSDFIPRDPFFAFKMAKHEVDRTALTEQELMAVESKVFDIPRLEQLRDIFLFCCYTGLAYADVAKLKASDLGEGQVGEKWVNIKRQKTDTVSRIPLLPQALRLLKKYANHAAAESGLLLPVLSNQKMNAYLKEIGDVCKIKKPITFHLARHTFATTVTLSNGVPIESVSRMLGHRSLKTTQIYAKVVDAKLSEDMKKLSELLTVKGKV